MTRKNPVSKGTAYDKLLDILSYKDYSSQEVYDKLTAKGFPEHDAADAVARAVGNGLIDDSRYAESVAARKMHSCGKRAVLFELKKRGIPLDLAEKTVDGLFEDFDVAADILPEMRRRLKGQDIGDPKVRNRVFGAFSRHGYDFEDINKAFMLCKEEYED